MYPMVVFSYKEALSFAKLFRFKKLLLEKVLLEKISLNNPCFLL